MKIINKKVRMNKILLILMLLVITSCFRYTELEKEIVGLKSHEEIKSYWEYLHEMDKKYRGKETIDSIDNINFKKMILMIKHHGYPSEKDYGRDNNIVPNLIFTHQESDYVCEKYLPIFYNELLKGKADTTWFLYNIQGLHRRKFGRDYIRGRDLKFSDIDTLLGRIGFLKEKSTFDLEEFDALFLKFQEDVNRIKSGEIIDKWSRERKGSYWIINYEGELYVYREYNDGSYKFPQRVKYDEKNQRYTYPEDIGFEDDFRVDENGDLVVTIDKRDLNRMIVYEQEVLENGDTTYNRIETFMEKTVIYFKED